MFTSYQVCLLNSIIPDHWYIYTRNVYIGNKILQKKVLEIVHLGLGETIDVKSIDFEIHVNQILHYHYSCIKFKNKFMKWLWKARETTCKVRYHPRYLVENLVDEDTELDTVLEKW